MLTPIDKEETLARLNGNIALLTKIVGLFQSQVGDYLGQIETALQAADSHHLEEAAHTLKGSIGNFTKQEVYELAFLLEQNGRNSELGSSAETFEQLKTATHVLQGDLRQWLSEIGA